MKDIFRRGPYLAPVLPGIFSYHLVSTGIVPALSKWLTSVISCICHKSPRRKAFFICIYRNRGSGSLNDFPETTEIEKSGHRIWTKSGSNERFEKKCPRYSCQVSVVHLGSPTNRDSDDSPRNSCFPQAFSGWGWCILTGGREASGGGGLGSQPERGNPTGTGPARSKGAFPKKEQQNTPYAKMLGCLSLKFPCLEEMNEERSRSGQMVTL